MRFRGFALLAATGVVFAVGCGAGGGDPREVAATTASAIQGGADDAVDAFSVGVCGGSPGHCTRICSGTLIAPNLVVTARHCIGEVAPGPVDCAGGKFGPPDDPSQIVVTTDASMFDGTHWYAAKSFVVPADDALCGSDLALIVLTTNVPADVATPATPNVAYAMTDATHVGLVETAIGYGVDAPTDPTSYGHRRVRGGVAIACVPHYPDASLDCTTDPQAETLMRGTEYVAGDATCEGDSGSGAYEQTSFAAGSPLVLGALSRGGVSADGKTCEGAIYTRLDAYAQLVIDAGKSAAKAGGYDAPAWTNASPPAVDTSFAGADAAAPPASGGLLGADCQADGDCASSNCSKLNDGPFVCTAACSATSSCPNGFACLGGYCFASSGASQNAAATTGATSGCALVSRDPTKPIPWLTLAFAASAIAIGARRRRR